MKPLMLLTYFLFVATSSHGQHKFDLKLYQNTDIFDITYKERFTPSENIEEVNFHRVSLAFSVSAKNNLKHEFELFIPEISKSFNKAQFPMNYEYRRDDTFSGEISTYSIRYEVNKSLSNNSNRLALNIGVGLNPYYVQIDYIPIVSTTFFRSDKFLGAAFNFIPRINYKLSDRLTLDLNVPLKIYDLQWQEINIKNPAIPIRHQTSQDFDSLFFEEVIYHSIWADVLVK